MAIMDNIRKYGKGFVRSSLLSAGLIGLYLYRKKRIPEYMSFVPWWFASMGLYVLAVYLLEDEFDELDRDKDKPKSLAAKKTEGTPASKSKPPFARRITVEEFDKEISKVLPDFDLNVSKSDEDRPKNEPIKLRISELKRFAPDDATKEFFERQGIDETKEVEIVLPTSPVHMKIIDINNQTVENSDKPPISVETDIIDQYRLSQARNVAPVLDKTE